jgi:hypothetical protein
LAVWQFGSWELEVWEFDQLAVGDWRDWEFNGWELAIGVIGS